MPFHDDIIKLAKENTFFRHELTTGAHSQVVIMSLKPGEDIGNEVHHVDQVLFFINGTGEATLNNSETSVIGPNHLVHVPAGTWHNFRNTSETDMKLFTVYAPAEHAPGTVHKTKAEADAAEAAEHK
ncbi:MAG: cupin domain-containing protein [Patescibacteria group bacterium]|jgi:mannose-6-phosphate isomerase-like protein (cupin superfamily)